jgi:CGNR zinc finger
MCAAEEYRRVFFDRSKPATRRWCMSTLCGNRSEHIESVIAAPAKSSRKKRSTSISSNGRNCRRNSDRAELIAATRSINQSFTI